MSPASAALLGMESYPEPAVNEVAPAKLCVPEKARSAAVAVIEMELPLKVPPPVTDSPEPLGLVTATVPPLIPCKAPRLLKEAVVTLSACVALTAESAATV